MADKDTLWTAVKAAYATELLLPLTNIHDTSGATIDDTVGTSAAEQVIGLWPIHVEAEFDVLNVSHMAVGIRAVIAVLLERGGVADDVADEEYDEVFGDSGLVAKLKRTTSRGRSGPLTTGPDLAADGTPRKAWSQTLPRGLSPSSAGADED